MSYTPVLFQAVAREVVNGYSEQYLVSFANGGITVMFSTPAIEEAIAKASAQIKDCAGASIIAAEYMVGRGFVNQDCVFSDECDGVMDMDGVLVEVSIRKIREGVHRVFFSRVDSARLYIDIAGRLKALEKSVSSLAAATA